MYTKSSRALCWKKLVHNCYFSKSRAKSSTFAHLTLTEVVNCGIKIVRYRFPVTFAQDTSTQALSANVNFKSGYTFQIHCRTWKKQKQRNLSTLLHFVKDFQLVSFSFLNKLLYFLLWLKTSSGLLSLTLVKQLILRDIAPPAVTPELFPTL